MKNSDAEIDIEARNLADLVERVNKIAVLADEEKRASLIEGLSKQIYTKFKVSIGLEKEEQKEPEKPDFFAMKMLKKIAKKIFGIKTPEEEAREAAEYEKTKEIEARIFVAVNKLRSRETTDSKQNDMAALDAMIDVVEIASDTRVPPYVSEQARQEIGKFSVTVGGSEDVVKQAAYKEREEVYQSSLADSIRTHFSKKTGDIFESGPEVTPGQKVIQDRNFEKSSNDLTQEKLRRNAQEST